MKFYEFNAFPYYALIGADSKKEAIEDYKEEVSDLDDDSKEPDEMTHDEVLKKLLSTSTGKDDDARITKEFEQNIKHPEPYLISIDGSLI